MSAELQSHIELHIDDNIRAGMPPDEARRRALVSLGGVEALKEQYRDRRGLPWLETVLQDVRFGLRMIRRNPGFSTVAIGALTIGIGANIGIFSVANAVLLRPLPIADPASVVRVATFNFSNTPYGEFLTYRDGNRTLESLATFTGVSLSLREGDVPEHIFGMAVSGNYFATLGVAAARGRTILDADDRIGATGMLMLSDRFWRRRFNGDPGVLGRQIRVNGQAYLIGGITSPEFLGTMAPFVPDVWVPWNGPGIGGAGAGASQRSGQVVGRLRPGVSEFQAQTDLNALAAGIARESPTRPADLRVTVSMISTLSPEFAPAVMLFVGALTALVGLVLLIACVNIANLLLARSAARTREVAVRLAIGAGRWRLIRQLLTESALLAVLGTAGGAMVAALIVRVVSAMDVPTPIPVAVDLSFDWRTLAFAAALASVTTMLFGLVPAWQSARTTLTMAMKNGTAGAGFTRSRLRALLVVSQVALSTLLLVTGAVLIRSMAVARAIDIGFATDGVMTASIDLGAGGYTTDRGRAFFDDVLTRLEQTPGIRAATLTPLVPLTLSNNMQPFYTDGDPVGRGERPFVYFNHVTRGHFATLGIPLLQGRDFTAADRPDGLPVGIVNETLARLFWPGQNPIGRRLQARDAKGQGEPWIEIVGVVRNSKYVTIGENAVPFLYLPLTQHYHGELTLLAKSAMDDGAALAAMRGVVRSLDPELPLFNVSPLARVTAVSLLPVQVAAAVAGALGTVGLLLAAIGLYGVMSFVVRQRVNEIGTRIALGATPRDVIRVITRQGMRWTALGLTIGLGLSWLLTRLLTNLLYGVEATDPVAFLGITMLLAATAYAACYVPARRASRMDPLIALRHE